MKKIWLLLGIALILIGCAKGASSNNEPPNPTDMGISREKYSYDDAAGLSSALLKTLQVPSQCEALNASNQPVRVAALKAFDQDNRILTYDIQYPGYGLESVAKFRLGTYRAILEETFPNKWLIKYEYNKEYPEKLGLPYSYSIYSYSSGHDAYEQLVNKYTLSEKGSGILRFRDDQGRSVDRDILYFVVVPDER
jgi:hypothetical protein